MFFFKNEKRRYIILSWSLVGVFLKKNEKRRSIILSWSLVGFSKKMKKGDLSYCQGV